MALHAAASRGSLESRDSDTGRVHGSSGSLRRRRRRVDSARDDDDVGLDNVREVNLDNLEHEIADALFAEDGPSSLSP